MFNSFHQEGEIAFRKGEFEQAITLFLQAINESPELPLSYLFLGESCFKCGLKSEAIEPLRRYINFSKNDSLAVPNILEAFKLLGQCYESENKDNAAIACYHAITKTDSSSAFAWHRMGFLSTKSALAHLERDVNQAYESFMAAKEFLAKALAICKENPEFLNSVASWYEKYIKLLEKSMENEEAVQANISNNFELAIEYYRKALDTCSGIYIEKKNDILSNLTECLARYGHHLYRSKNFIKAQEYYIEVLELDPSHLSAITQMGMSFSKQNQFAEARQFFSDILGKTEDQQDRADAWLNIASTYRSEMNLEEAEKALNKAKNLAPEDPNILKEEKELAELKAQAILIAARQAWFAKADKVVVVNEPEKTESQEKAENQNASPQFS